MTDDDPIMSELLQLRAENARYRKKILLIAKAAGELRGVYTAQYETALRLEKAIDRIYLASTGVTDEQPQVRPGN